MVGEGIATRHAWVWIGEAGLQVEPLGGQTFVNGHAISERVQVEYPALVQVGAVTLALELLAPRVAEPAPESLAETIPFARVQPSKPASSVHDIAITIPTKASKPQTPVEDPTRAVTVPSTRSGAKTTFSKGAAATDAHAFKAPLRGEYTLVKEIARGGMGQIHLGEDPRLERQVAVKVSRVA